MSYVQRLKRPWFVKDKKYRVIRDIAEVLPFTPPGAFEPGIILTFLECLYDRHESCSRYNFENNEIYRIASHYDGEPEPRWEHYFEPIDE